MNVLVVGKRKKVLHRMLGKKGAFDSVTFPPKQFV